ncbi:DNA-binding transcriptional regulator, LysR family [Clostridium grantii DSM 8605]|uniref:DNA-binding transcriptional regulator, LysR family n=2 Tax=Clostridium TaxID=1485 RepID=A0A1M5WFG1_9CLOT|nr:DNA-binding transcriptional regulator, LysR family [Clostridium grantii DSM 8605]
MKVGINMTIRHLQVFIAVCDYGKMSLAAENLHISQPTVSQAISELEKYYGIKLFQRLSKKLYITESGEKLLSYARHIVSSFNEMEENIILNSKNITLKIGATITVGTCIINDILKKFQINHPEVKTKVFVENTGVIEDMMLKSRLDIGIVEGKVKSPYIVKIPIIYDELILVSSMDHEFSNLKEINIEQLENSDFILREKGSGTREFFEKALEKSQVTINEKWICNNSEAIKNAVICGQGLTVISKLLIEKELEDKKLHPIIIKDVKFQRNFHIIYHKNKYLSDNIKNFISVSTT